MAGRRLIERRHSEIEPALSSISQGKGFAPIRRGLAREAKQSFGDMRSQTRVWERGRKLYADIARPINSECRDLIQQRVLDEYEEEVFRSKQAGYICRYDDYDAGEYDLDEAHRWDAIHDRQSSAATRRIDPPAEPALPGPHEVDRPLELADRSPDEWYGNKG